MIIHPLQTLGKTDYLPFVGLVCAESSQSVSLDPFLDDITPRTSSWFLVQNRIIDNKAGW